VSSIERWATAWSTTPVRRHAISRRNPSIGVQVHRSALDTITGHSLLSEESVGRDTDRSILEGAEIGRVASSCSRRRYSRRAANDGTSGCGGGVPSIPPSRSSTAAPTAGASRLVQGPSGVCSVRNTISSMGGHHTQLCSNTSGDSWRSRDAIRNPCQHDAVGTIRENSNPSRGGRMATLASPRFLERRAA